MTWNCPECGVRHEDDSQECICGFSFFKILGIKPGSTREEAGQAYKYLLSVWGKDGSFKDAPSHAKAEARMKKIEGAYEAFKQYSSPVAEGAKGVPKKAVLVGAAAGILLLLLLGVFFFRRQDRATPEHSLAPAADKGVTTSPLTAQGKGALSREPSPDSPPVVAPPGGGLTEQASSLNAPSAITEEEAVAIVKKSDALLKNTPVESIIRKWTEDNAGKYKVVGWQARKIDEQKYLVSFTALDGSATKGFYFVLDGGSRVVQDLARSPELQNKYNVRYGE